MAQFYPCYKLSMAESDVGPALPIERGSRVAVIGGGGKTTTMLRLAGWAEALDWRVLITTTTKICVPDGRPVVLVDQTGSLLAEVRAALRRSSVVVAGQSVRSDGKLLGLPPDAVDALSETVDLVVCEADGSRRRPLKVHGPGEPVVPAASTHVLILAGLDAVGRPAQEVVHRPECFTKLTGLTPEAPITPALVARCLAAALVYVPPGAQPAFLCNKADTPLLAHLASEIAAHAELLAPGVRTYATAYGYLVGDSASLYS